MKDGFRVVSLMLNTPSYWVESGYFPFLPLSRILIPLDIGCFSLDWSYISNHSKEEESNARV